MNYPTRVKRTYAAKAVAKIETPQDAMQAAMVLLEIAGALCNDWELGCLDLDNMMDPIAKFLGDIEPDGEAA